MFSDSSTDIVRTVLVLAWMLVAAPPATAEEPATPTPTPRPGTLADYARHVTLDTSGLGSHSGAPVLGMDEISALADGRSLIAAATLAADATPRPTPSAQTREQWRKRIFAQRKRVADVESRRRRVAAQIDLLESGRLTIAVLARIDRARIELDALDADLRRERLELGRLVREARRHGAEPGWFR